jgi:hypothetical protein
LSQPEDSISASKARKYWGAEVAKDRDSLAQAHLALVHLLQSRIITNETRHSAETLKAQLEAELVKRVGGKDFSKTSA